MAIAVVVLIIAFAHLGRADRRRRASAGAGSAIGAHRRARRAARVLRVRHRSARARASAPAPAADRSPPAPPRPSRILGWLINGFAPLVGAIGWLKYLSPFYYYAGHDPLTHGVDIAGIIVLGGVALLLTVVAAIPIEHRDLRA